MRRFGRRRRMGRRRMSRGRRRAFRPVRGRRSRIGYRM